MTSRTRTAIAISILLFFSMAANATLTEENDGSTIDFAAGASLNVLLKVPAGEIYQASCLWSKITTSAGTVLEEVPKAVLLPTGVTAGSFRALAPGTAQLSSSRNDCAKGGTIEWQVTVRVR